MVADDAKLERTLTLRGAVTLNLLDMIGVGPFITLPLLLGAMGGPQAMLGWVCGAALALCDGLVWAELGAAIPEAGGTFQYLRVIFPGRLGQWLSFLFVFQLCISAPLSVASGGIGLGQYATALLPARFANPGVATWIAIGAVVLALILLYRKLDKLGALSAALLALVLATIGWSVVTALLHGHIAQAWAHAPGAFTLDHGFFLGLGAAMLIATYDYWGYYNVTFLAGEVREPGKTIPRAVLLSIAIVFVLYLALNVSVLSVLPAPVLLAQKSVEARQALLSLFMQTAYAPSLGAGAASALGKVAAVMVMTTAFASVFALLLGYSRIPFAAARAGAFLAPFGKLHPTRKFPHISLLALGAVACVACLFSLAHVIAALVVLRILLQFLLQHVGVMYLRRTQPDLPRPFKLWLYPLPPLLAICGFVYVVVERPHVLGQLTLAAIVAVTGSAVFLLWARKSQPTSDKRWISLS